VSSTRPTLGARLGGPWSFPQLGGRPQFRQFAKLGFFLFHVFDGNCWQLRQRAYVGRCVRRRTPRRAVSQSVSCCCVSRLGRTRAEKINAPGRQSERIAMASEWETPLRRTIMTTAHGINKGPKTKRRATTTSDRRTNEKDRWSVCVECQTTTMAVALRAGGLDPRRGSQATQLTDTTSSPGARQI